MARQQNNIWDDQRLRRLVEVADVPTLVVANEGTVDLINQRATALIGYSAEDLGHLSSIDIFHPDERGFVRDRTRRSRRGEVMFPAFSTRLLSKGGEVIPAQLTALPCEWMGKDGFLLFLRDQTLEKKLEEQLVASQRLQSIGTLAAGVAHDFNNLLMGIQGRISLMRADIEEEHPFHEELAAMERQIQGGAKLTSQLLSYAREVKPDVRTHDLNHIVSEAAAAFGRTHKEIELELDLAGDLLPISADRGAIEQVLLNLYINAADAMPDGGVLTLRTRNAVEAELAATHWDLSPAPYVMLSVIDCGIGMDEQTLARIFEPFYTTKGAGEGTGLGLASVYGIVKAHHGYIDVHSAPGAGTTFNIYLQGCEAPSGKDDASAQPSRRSARGTETILFVDDEESITSVVCRMLSRLGYKVLVANSGREAEQIYKDQWHRIDLVILDMIMPGMSGEQTFEVLSRINPEVRVLVSSGYSNVDQTSAILREGGNVLIRKPYTVEELTREVRGILDTEIARP